MGVSNVSSRPQQARMERNRRVTCVTLSSILLVLYVVWFMYPHLPVKKKKKYAILTDLSTREDLSTRADSLPLIRLHPPGFNPSTSPNPNLHRMVGSSKCSSKPVLSFWDSLDYFTILLTVREGNEGLVSTLIGHYCAMDHVDRLLVVWSASGRGDHIPHGAIDSNCSACVVFLNQPEDLATNRFKPFLQIRTRGL